MEILLADWIPRKIVALAAYLAKDPDLLRSFIRFSHHERDVRPALTDQTLAAVDEYEPDCQRVIRLPRPRWMRATRGADPCRPFDRAERQGGVIRGRPQWTFRPGRCAP